MLYWQDPSNLLALLDMTHPPLCSHTPARQAPQPPNPCYSHTRASQVSTLPTPLAAVADLSWPMDVCSLYKSIHLEGLALVAKEDCICGPHRSSPTQGHSQIKLEEVPLSSHTYKKYGIGNGKSGKMRQINVFLMKK